MVALTEIHCPEIAQTTSIKCHNTFIQIMNSETSPTIVYLSKTKITSSPNDKLKVNNINLINIKHNPYSFLSYLKKKSRVNQILFLFYFFLLLNLSSYTVELIGKKCLILNKKKILVILIKCKCLKILKTYNIKYFL